MTTLTASPQHHRPAGEAFRRRTCRPSASSIDRNAAEHAVHRDDGSSGEEFSTAIVDLPSNAPASATPAEVAAPSNPHRRQAARGAPAGSFPEGFRTPALSTG